MYLYLGGNRLVRQAEVVGIFDLDTATVSRHTRDFLTKAERDGRVETVSYELPKAFVLCAPPRRQAGGRDGKKPADQRVAGCVAKVGGQTAKVGGQTAKVGGQTAKVGGQTAKAGGRIAKADAQTAETAGRTMETVGQTAGANRTGRQAQRGGPKKADGRIYISQLSSSTLLRRADVFKSGNAREPDI